MNWVELRGVTELDLTSFFSLGGSIIGVSGPAYPSLWERSNRPCSARRFRREGHRYFFSHSPICFGRYPFLSGIATYRDQRREKRGL